MTLHPAILEPMGFILSASQIFALLSWALAAVWIWKGIAALRGMKTLPAICAANTKVLPSSTTNSIPDITVVVPARDEAAAIDSCLRSLLASTGTRLQIIAVNDRSSDGTGNLMDAIASKAHVVSGPHAFEVIHISDLPPGWLGKPHALAMGAQRAAAPWILFTDGDVSFAPNALSLAVREATTLKADHMVLVPTLILKSAGERSVLAAMQAVALWAVRLWKVSDQRTRDFIGAGGFNMIRRDVYEQIGGFEALRMEILEDLYLGKRVKQAGFNQRIVIGHDLVRVRWIDSAFSVIRLVEKNGFAVTRFRTGLHLLACLSFVIDAVWPIIAIACGGWTTVAGLMTYLGITLAYRASCRVTRVPARYALFFAPAILLVAYGFLRSMILALLRRGVVWRGTLYPLSDLRRAARES